MIRKLVLVLVLALVTGGFAAYGQDATPAPQTAPPPPETPAQQPPQAEPASAGQQPSSAEESSDLDITKKKKTVRVHDYRNWVFNVGGGASLGSGTTKTFVRGGGGVASAGVARNFSRYLGLKADFIWANLPLRDSALVLAQAPGATTGLYALNVGPIINIPVNKKYAGYFVVAPGFYHRQGKLDSSTLVPGSPCNTFWQWWGVCSNGIVSLSTDFLKSSQNEFGFNFGAAVTRKVGTGFRELYLEARYMHGSHNGIATNVEPLIVGLRW